jgi:spoIIIJ-associated protein
VNTELKDEIQEAAMRVCACMKFSVAVETGTDEEGYHVVFSGKDCEYLLQKNGEVLNSLEYILNRIFSERLEKDQKITTDANDFRRIRREELCLIAEKASEKVGNYGTTINLQAMPPHERRIIHMALKDHPKVKTVSEGVGDDRKVIIMPVR